MTEATKPGTLSAKERRKQRNERREELKDLKGSWRDEVETKLDVKKKAPKGWEEILDINQLTTKGMQWWMIAVPKNGEQRVADHIELVFQRLFPKAELQVRFSLVLDILPILFEVHMASRSLSMQTHHQWSTVPSLCSELQMF